MIFTAISFLGAGVELGDLEIYDTCSRGNTAWPQYEVLLKLPIQLACGLSGTNRGTDLCADAEAFAYQEFRPTRRRSSRHAQLASLGRTLRVRVAESRVDRLVHSPRSSLGGADAAVRKIGIDRRPGTLVVGPRK